MLRCGLGGTHGESALKWTLRPVLASSMGRDRSPTRGYLLERLRLVLIVPHPHLRSPKAHYDRARFPRSVADIADW